MLTANQTEKGREFIAGHQTNAESHISEHAKKIAVTNY